MHHTAKGYQIILRVIEFKLMVSTSRFVKQLAKRVQNCEVVFTLTVLTLRRGRREVKLLNLWSCEVVKILKFGKSLIIYLMFVYTCKLENFLTLHLSRSLATAVLCEQSIFFWSAHVIFRIKRLVSLSIIFF